MMADAEHISKPIRRVMDVLEVIYVGDDYDQAIEQKLKELGIHENQVGVIIAIPEEMADDKNDKQIPLFS